MSTGHLTTAQKLSTDALVSLYQLDCRELRDTGGNPGLRYCWTPGTLGDAKIVYGGLTYEPMPILITGVEYTGKGPLPRPKVSVSNIEGLASGIMNSLGDALGATVIRIRTFARYLDGQPFADAFAHWEPEVYRVERKSKQNHKEIELELSSVIDQQGALLPNRQCLQSTCTHIYRRWVPGFGFDYTNATCPYSGSAVFDRMGVVAESDSKDACGLRLSDCRLRFGENGILPIASFPGMTLGR